MQSPSQSTWSIAGGFSQLNVKAKIQDNIFQVNVKVKIQDKEGHLRQCQGKISGQGSKLKNIVKSKIQNKKAHLRWC